MLNIFGKTLPVDKSIEYSLTKIFGINLYTSKKICKNLGLNPSIRTNYLTILQIKKLNHYIDSNFLIEHDLKKKKIQNIQNLTNIKTYRGLRNFYKLPVRGQRTHTNAKTKKKKS